MQKSRAVLCAALVGCFGWKAARAQGTRVMVLVEEQVGGTRTSAGTGEAKLTEALLKNGYAVVERYEAEQARSKISIDRMLHGETAGLEVTGLHADVLVAGRIGITKEEAPYGISYAAHRARIELRVVMIDTGRIVHADSAEAAAPGDPGVAAGKVVQHVLPALLAALKKSGEMRDVIELRVAGLKDAKQADQLAAAIGKTAGVKSAKVRYVSADATVIDVAASDATRLDGPLSAFHLVVARRSAGVVEAKMDESAVARRTVAVARFANRTGRADLAWIEQMLPDVFETELLNSKYLAPSAAAGRPAIDPDKPQVRGITADVVVIGKIERAGAGLRLSARAVKTADGSVLAAAQLFGNEAGVAELGKELVWKLDAPLYQKLLGRSSLEGYISPIGKAPAPTRGGAMVRIEEVKLGDLFPSRIGYYAHHPLGRVVLRNDGDRPADDVRVEVSLGELSGGAQTVRAPAIPAGGRVEVELKVVLDRARLLEVGQRRPARADLAIIAGGKRDGFTEPVVLWDRNALDWGQPDSVAAFVTPRDPVVGAFAQAAAKLREDAPKSLPPAVRTASAAFDAVITLGTRYARDPLSPYGERAIDTVQFPRETLARRAGDCDDLAVLYASLIQALGQNARLVLTPGHIFVAIDSEVPIANADRLGGAARVISLAGHAWIPVEITRLDGGFAAAWRAGLEEIGRYPDKVSYVDVPAAWQTYPPFPMDAPGSAPEVPAAETRRLLAAETVGTTAAPSTSGSLDEAVAAARSGSYADARAKLARLADDPATPKTTRAQAWNDLGNVETLDKHYDDAVRAYERARGAGARQQVVDHNLGVVHFLAGRGAEARKHLLRSGTPESKKLAADLGLATQTHKAAAKKADATAPADSSEALEGLRGADAASRVDPANVLIWMK